MSSDDSSRDPGADSRPGAGPYEFALFIARSFGTSLPVVVIVGLIAYGAWYAIGEMSVLQTRIIDAERQKSEAEIKKAQAESDAKRAGDIAKYDALQEYSKQLTDLNTVSADVSKRLQDLVGNQLDNMKRASELTEIQDKKTRDYQDQILAASKGELEKSRAELEVRRAEVAEASKKSEELVLAAALAGYNAIKGTIATQLASDYGAVADPLLDTLGEGLKDPRVENQAIKDAADNTGRWDIRVALNIQLFRKTSQESYLESARVLTSQNKRLARPPVAGLFNLRYGTFSDQQRRIAIPVVVGLILDSGLQAEFRVRLLDSLTYPGLQLSELLSPGSRDELVRYVGNRLVEVTRSTDPNSTICYSVEALLRLLGDVSPEIQRESARLALASAGGRDEQDRQCVRSTLEKAGQKPAQP